MRSRALVVVLIGLLGAACTSTVRPTASPTTSATVQVRPESYPGPFVPDAIQALDNRLWLIGTSGSRCAVERLDPSTLEAETFPLPSCGSYVAAGTGHLYLVAVNYDRSTQIAALHLESLDAATGRATVMAPVMDTMTIGSGLAHMGLAYDRGWLWLYDWGDEALLRVSPASGAVTGEVTGILSGGGHPVMAADRSGLWVAEGPGGQRLFHLEPGSTRARTVYRAQAPASLLWVATLGTRVWAKIASYPSRGATASTHLVAFDSAGHRVMQTSPGASGDSAVGGLGAQLWSVGTGTTCQGPQRVWRTDGATGRTAAVATLHPPIAPCLTEGNQQLQVVAGYVFVLDGTGETLLAGVLYRLSLA